MLKIGEVEFRGVVAVRFPLEWLVLLIWQCVVVELIVMLLLGVVVLLDCIGVGFWMCLLAVWDVFSVVLLVVSLLVVVVDFLMSFTFDSGVGVYVLYDFCLSSE